MSELLGAARGSSVNVDCGREWQSTPLGSKLTRIGNAVGLGAHWLSQERNGWVGKIGTMVSRVLAPPVPCDPVHFVVVAFGRSGSTMLVDLLQSHRDIVCYHEPFNVGTPHRPLNSEQDVIALAREIFRDGIEGGPRKYGRPQFHFGRSPAIGFKMTVGQLLETVPGLSTWLESQKSQKVIFLDRRSNLRRHVSYQVAWRRNIWHVRRKEDAITPSLRVEPAKFNRFLRRKAAQLAALDALLARTDCEVLSIDYESLVARRKETVNRVVRFLGLEPAPGYSASTTKIIAAPLESVIENYQEIARLFPREIGIEL